MAKGKMMELLKNWFERLKRELCSIYALVSNTEYQVYNCGISS